MENTASWPSSPAGRGAFVLGSPGPFLSFCCLPRTSSPPSSTDRLAPPEPSSPSSLLRPWERPLPRPPLASVPGGPPAWPSNPLPSLALRTTGGGTPLWPASLPCPRRRVRPPPPPAATPGSPGPPSPCSCSASPSSWPGSPPGSPKSYRSAPSSSWSLRTSENLLPGTRTAGPPRRCWCRPRRKHLHRSRKGQSHRRSPRPQISERQSILPGPVRGPRCRHTAETAGSTHDGCPGATSDPSSSVQPWLAPSSP
mmetsp:Transcript_32806/g.85156  ORF Transcript_32806/g.85156 Transcript_32806/m.85156 type:complete len:254 (+) Transcript_32806:800-1561(+)